MCTKTDPVVETKAGKLRGFQLDGTYVFHGVKYADAKRFHQPTPVEPWEGIKNALAYGYVCPMLQQDQPSNELMVPHRYWPLDENCQYLNIWTQHLDPNAKKPVLVWLHGGGFAAGDLVLTEGLQEFEVAEAAVVGYPHDIKGQGIYAYVTLMKGSEPSEALTKELLALVGKEIGSFAKPELIQWAPGLPKTRSGKIMRRILRKIAVAEYDSLGDISTLADPGVVQHLIDTHRTMQAA